MTDISSIGFGAAFLAGLLSFFSPCVLPLIPVNIAIISGVSVEALKAGEKSAFWPTVSRTLVFILGFSTVFVALGAGAGTIGGFLRDHDTIIRVGGGIIVLVFGLHLVGLTPISLFYRQGGSLSSAGRRFGMVGVYLMGTTFAIVWQPCVGPILGGILTLAATEGKAGYGAALLLVYSAGLGLPFILAAAAMGTFLNVSARVKRYLVWIEKGSGILLITLGVLLISDKFQIIVQWAVSLYKPAV